MRVLCACLLLGLTAGAFAFDVPDLDESVLSPNNPGTYLFKPVAYTTTNTEHGFVLIRNDRGFRSLAISCKNTGADTVTWRVNGTADYVGGATTVVATTDILSTASATYVVSPAPYLLYGMYGTSKVADTPGQLTCAIAGTL